MKTKQIMLLLIGSTFLSSCNKISDSEPKLDQAKPASTTQEIHIKPAPVDIPNVSEPSTKKLEPDEIFQKVSKSIILVMNPDAGLMGSGVEIGNNIFVTNCHVLKDGSNFYIKREGFQTTATLLDGSFDKDICLLNSKTSSTFPAEIRSSADLNIGERVYAVGNPQGFELTISEGIISQLRSIGGAEKYPYIQTTAPISQGSSGGGVFDTKGNLIGISSFMWKEGQNLNFAAPIDWASELVPTYTNTPELPSSFKSLLSKKNTKGARDLNKQAIVLIKNEQILEAINILENAESMSSLDSEILGNLGYAYMLNGRYNEARDKFMLALKISPMRAATWLNLGQTFAELDAPDIAVECVTHGYSLASRKEAVRNALIDASNDSTQSEKWQNVATSALMQL